MSLLEIASLSVSFGRFNAVEGVDLTVEAGEIVGIVGESGSGKSVTMMALMGLLDSNGHIKADRMQFDGQDLLTISERARRRIVGRDIAMIFQDPMTSLNPSYTVGFQIMEVLRLHQGLRGSALKARAVELMEMVEIPAAKSRLDTFPHQLSGGMSQRVVIAMAIACNPKLLIADEPTTALDVTIQAQIMNLLVSLQKEQGMALVMITHDLAVIAEVAQRVQVMYAGQVVETGTVPQLFRTPRHPYTGALLAAIPEHSKGAERLQTLPGVVPGAWDRPAGCLLGPRCPFARPDCHAKRPSLVTTPQGESRCYYPLAYPEVA
ncbi:ATP-binding cassette domain-containing protein [Laribacter hongkongensis]|uniref:ABC transporter ATP-binding protein n=1 Tax=Laribacter hongkongensis TaxID=168471 RepID=UPI001EFC3838|nr:oligopeptide/dipeptide ABC transporter ATP-binding protein [Laribacter hongkongensis]MCG8994184.1 ATP-binding cassette domain-containing protein [Laribacter hongkongensis]MCG9010591.1 ATP-binding cassette domain-containing protein [Laribacter hongkongensis]MCG9023777.1 ATP-binding cassette domain-containing protein [Laribacter hongkongensis]MCG9046141.1 ATP-binding cassette domain-containing protein [Laribacter hongkongensis]MCG9073550.1 ATP-binding cassette domain-containing protein [Larib